MKFTNLLLICMCCVMVAPAAWGQAANNAAKPGILGYLDPKTGAFRPVPSATDEVVDPATFTTFGGTITVTLTITVKSTALTVFTCSAEVSVEDNVSSGNPRSLAESATATATGTGATRTCKLTIPYAWSLATHASDSMSTGYFAFGNGASTTGADTSRSSSVLFLDTRPVPANGATTALTAAVTL
jgi:hypothetical protein